MSEMTGLICCFCNNSYNDNICEECIVQREVVANNFMWICKCDIIHYNNENNCNSCNTNNYDNLRNIEFGRILFLFMRPMENIQSDNYNISNENNISNDNNINDILTETEIKQSIENLKLYNMNYDYENKIKEILIKLLRLNDNNMSTSHGINDILNRAYLLLDYEFPTELMNLLNLHYIPFLMNRLDEMTIVENLNINEDCCQPATNLSISSLHILKEKELIDDINCVICCEKINNNRKIIKMTCCNNIVHYGDDECPGIIKWFKKYNNKCPFCRNKI